MSTRIRNAGAPGKAPAKPARKAAAKSPPKTARRRTVARKSFELILLGATGFTGRQAMRAVLRQRPDARWAVAGRDATRLRALVAKMVPPGARAPQVIVADTRDAASLQALARQGQVLFNLAGPYHATGDAVVAACIAGGTHYLDLSAETFWIQRLVREQHAAAQRARVKIIPCAGYEALPFDLATLWAAHQLRQQCGEPCVSVKIIVRITGRPITRPQDIVSGGTAATMTELLAHDHTDCLRDMACLLPPDASDAAGVARRNALHWLPRYDADIQAVTAPTMPGPFINPPVVLRGVALRDDPTLFADDFRYHEGTDMGSLLPGARAAAAACLAGAAVGRGRGRGGAAGQPGCHHRRAAAVPAPPARPVAPARGAKARHRPARIGAGCHRLRARRLRAWRQRRALPWPRRRGRSPGLPLDAGDGGLCGALAWPTARSAAPAFTGWCRRPRGWASRRWRRWLPPA